MKWFAFLFLTVIFGTVHPVNADDTIEHVATLGGYGHLVRMAWSPDGTMLAAHTSQGVIIFNDRLQFLRFLDRSTYSGARDNSSIGVVAWSRNSRYVANDNSAWETNDTQPLSVFIWDVTNGELVQTLHPDVGLWLQEIVWSPQGDALAAYQVESPYGSTETFTRLLVWDFATGELRFSRTHQHIHVTHLQWNDAGTQLHALYNRLRITFDADTGELAERAPEIGVQYRSEFIWGDHLLATVDADWLLVGEIDGGLYLPESYHLIDQYQGEIFWRSPLGFNHDETILIASGLEARNQRLTPKIYFINVEASPFEIEFDFPFFSVGPYQHQRGFSLHPQRNIFALAFGTGIQLWDIDRQILIAEQWISTSNPQLLKWSPDSRYMLISTGAGTVVWNVSTGDEAFSLINDVTFVDGDDRYTFYADAEWSPNGQFIVTKNRIMPKIVRLWNGQTGQLLDSISFSQLSHVTNLSIDAFTWSDDSQYLALLTSSDVNGIRIRTLWEWEIETGFLRTLLPEFNGSIISFATGGEIVYEHESIRHLYSHRSGQTTIVPPSTSPIQGVDVVAFEGSHFQVRDLATGSITLIPNVAVPERIRYQSMNPTATRFVIVDTEGTVYLWDISPDGSSITPAEQASVLTVQSHRYMPFVWSPNGQYFAVIGRDFNDSVTIWGERP